MTELGLASQTHSAVPLSIGYSPSTSYADLSDTLLDPFFDDNSTDSVAGPSSPVLLAAPAASQELFLGWNFDDDDGNSAHSEPNEELGITHSARKWKWPWEKEQIKTGERVVILNDDTANKEFCSNFVFTSKYNIFTFLPKFLFEQFSQYANLFFLFITCIQQFPGVSSTNRYTTIVPLVVVLLISAYKEVREDLKRRQIDSELNARKTEVLTPYGTFTEKAWGEVRVGDIVRLQSNDFVPVDMILMTSSEPEGLCFIETSNFDGETDLKIKQSPSITSSLTAPSLILSLRGSLLSEQPNNSLYDYEGTLHLATSHKIPLGPDQLLLRGAQLRNTSWLYGLTVFTGHETKLYMQSANATPIKRTAVERQVNVQVLFVCIFLLLLSLCSTIGDIFQSWFSSSSQWYLFQTWSVSGRTKDFFEEMLIFIVLYNNLVPISLVVTMQVVKFHQAQQINSDLDMYDPKTDTPAFCRTSSIVDELGQIGYVFSDKTGTLTCNEMEFRCCSVAGTDFTEEDNDEDGKSEWKSFNELQRIMESDTIPFESSAQSLIPEREVVLEFLILLAVCHTVIPRIKDEKVVYEASSPDEVALVNGAQRLGVQLRARKPNSVIMSILGRNEEYEILNVCEFSSARKRMSTIVRGPDGKIKIYTKGADTVILERLSADQPYSEATLDHLERYATRGLRTLCIAFRVIPEEEYKEWSQIYHQAKITITNRGEALDRAAELIEKNLFLLGATAIEDKLQDGVPETIRMLQVAGIKVWVLTGDRQETSISVGMSCQLISEVMNLVIVNEETAQDTENFLTKRVSAIKNQQRFGELEDLALIIDGRSLAFALKKEICKTFLELAAMCKAVICCRVSPMQKASIVNLVKKHSTAILLAIGDGANDVGMIQAAHVGVGISGVEGLQAARSADVTISQFRFLKKLLLVHGAWSYRRLSRLILYSFYKNIVLSMTQFWYSFFNNFSGQIAYESWNASLYNLVFTVLPPFVIGILDQFVSAKVLDRYPQLYRLGQKNVFFKSTALGLWIVNALFHSLLCFGFSVILFWGDLKLADGLDSGHWFWGTSLYLVVLVTVLGKAALISDIWTKYTVLAIPGSFVFTMLFLPLCSVVITSIGFSTEYAGIVPRLWTSTIYYFALILVPALCLVSDAACKYYRRVYMPLSYHIVQEIQKYNIPDYRPRIERFQKAIKKVRATQRMRRNRGFAFTQTENSDQARIIRAYDTSMTAASPSGY